MVPCWPFLHTHGECCVGQQILISPGAHSMASSYIPGASGFASWDAFQRSPDPLAHKDLTFLESAIKAGHSFGALTLKAIMYALKKLIRTAQVILGVALIGALSLLDFLAWMFHKAAVMAKAYSEALLKVLGGIMRFMGRTLESGAKLTETFIHFLLEQLFKLISSRATISLLIAVSSPAMGALPMDLPMTMMGLL